MARIVIPMDLRFVLNPLAFVILLEANGFTFDRTVCPIQLHEPKRMIVDEDAETVTYLQGEDAE